MEDVNISKFRAQVVREGSTPASPGFVVSEGQNPVDPAGSGQNHLPVTIEAAATGLTITESQVLGGAGTVGQYIRGDGSLADFPESSGGGSSVSYYLNGSVNQGTIGGVAYKELNKVPILGAGTDFTINANGYIASFITDAGDPNLLEIPGGNWNFETFFSANNGGGSPTFYVELYKYNGTTFTLIASNSTFPELIAFGTNVTAYFSTLAVPTTTLALTDRLAIRYYVTHSGRTIKLHTEDNHLCQIITTFTTGITALNGLTAQVQNFAVGTSGTDFAISSATATHTFNLPTASATNRGALSSADWTTFNNKMPAITFNAPLFIASGGSVGITQASGSVNGFLSSTDWTTFNGKENAITAGTTAQYFRGDKTFQTLNTAIVPELTNLYYTEARVNANTNVAANTAARHNAVTLGTPNGLSLSTQVLSLGLASAGVTGALSGTDWSTFNSKQNALTNPVTGTGTTNYLPKFTGASTIGNSQVFDNGTNVGINNITPADSYSFGKALDINGSNGAALYLRYSTDPTIQFGMIGYDRTGGGLSLATNNALPILFATNATTKMTLTDSGNLGLSVTPSAWDLTGILQNAGGSLWNTSSIIGINQNAFFGGSTWKYVSSAAVSDYYQTGGLHIWRQAPSGTAGNAINFTQAMTLTSGGNLLVGTITDNGARLQVSGSATFSSSVTANGDIRSNAIYRDYQGEALIQTSGSDTQIGSFGAGTPRTISLIAGNDRRLFITLGGNVLIGTTTSGASKLRIVGLPTSSSGLSSGDVWNNGGTLRIV